MAMASPNYYLAFTLASVNDHFSHSPLSFWTVVMIRTTLATFHAAAIDSQHPLVILKLLMEERVERRRDDVDAPLPQAV